LEQQLIELGEATFGLLCEQPAYLFWTHPDHRFTPMVASSP
jgi:hypothetical protein